MAGYSSTPLLTKLGIRAGQVLLLDRLPEDVELGDLDELGDLGGARVVRRLPAAMDVTLTFHTDLATLARRLPDLFERTSTAGMVWVCWPKKTAHRVLAARGVVCDIDENRVRALGLELGFVDVKVAAIDATWSGLKFVRRLADRHEVRS